MRRVQLWRRSFLTLPIIISSMKEPGGVTVALAVHMAQDLEVFKYGVLLFWPNASVLGTTAISLASAWAQGEVSSWRGSLNIKFKDAPGFYAVYRGAVMLAVGVVLIPGASLNVIILGVQALAGIMLPSAIVFLNLLLNDKQVLRGLHGSQFSTSCEQRGHLSDHHRAIRNVRSGGAGTAAGVFPRNGMR